MREIAEARRAIAAEIGKRIVGQESVIDHLLIALFARGHCLFVGVPGLAKTLLIQTLADVLDLSFKRIQFTPDLMPSDITGTDVLEEDRATGRRVFRFVRGPVFANVILADEINRTPPKTQAALLQSMQEYRVTAGGQTYDLPLPFLVFATQNPIEQEGTYPLPEAQLDRFMFQIDVELSVGGRGDPHRQPDDHAYRPALRKRAVARADPRAAGAGAARAGGQPRRALRGRAGARQPAQRGDRARLHQEVRVVGRGAARLAVPDPGGQGARDPRRPLRGVHEDVRALAMPVLVHRVLPNFHAEADGLNARTLVGQLIDSVKQA